MGWFFSDIFLKTFRFSYKPCSGWIVSQNTVFYFRKLKFKGKYLYVLYWSTALVKIFVKLTDISISISISTFVI